ncbi:MAG: hypothetical protein RL186_1532 [Pseudomonadota bacterium]
MSITLDLSHRPNPAAADIPQRTSLVGLTLDEMRDALLALGLDPKAARMRAKQIWRWLYFFGARDFDVMTDIGKDG